MKRAFNEKIQITEKKFYYDKEFNTSSKSTYIPLFINGKFIGILGCDLLITNYSKILLRYNIYTFLISIGLVVALLFVPLILLKFVRIDFFYRNFIL